MVGEGHIVVGSESLKSLYKALGLALSYLISGEKNVNVKITAFEAVLSHCAKTLFAIGHSEKTA